MWIDCDIASSATDARGFITPTLQNGTLLMFDDWNSHGSDPGQGEQFACAKWLSENPHVSLTPILSFGWHGKGFQSACNPRMRPSREKPSSLTGN